MKRVPAGSSLSDLALLQREINELFDRLGALERGGAGWQPCADVYERDDEFVVVLEAPGVAADTLEVVCQGSQVLVKGQRRERRPGGRRASFLCMERPQGRFQRTIPLAVPVDASRARATLAGGLLTITLPRLDDRRGREVAIRIEREDT